jgi:pimeloyl-ACP methyl ester carboxylesterase
MWLELPPVHLVGHPYGGYVATLLAAESPKLVRSLVLAEPAIASLLAGVPEAQPHIAEFGQARKTAFNSWQRGEHAAAIRNFLEYVFGAVGLARIEGEHYGCMDDNGAVIAAAFRQRPAPPPFTREQASAMRVPTLLLQGSASQALYGFVCDQFANCRPDIRRATLTGASHALSMEEPEQFNALLREFLAQN